MHVHIAQIYFCIHGTKKQWILKYSGCKLVIGAPMMSAKKSLILSLCTKSRLGKSELLVPTFVALMY